MFTLRPYQEISVERSIEFLTSKGTVGNGLLVLPTGAGKSLVIANIALRLDAPVLIFQPNKEILEQNFNKLCSYGFLQASIYSASCGSKQVNKITFATIGSAINNKEIFKNFKYIIIDECHLVNPNNGMYKEFLSSMEGSRVIGLTATPYRLQSYRDGSMLKFLTRTRGKVFGTLIHAVQIQELVEAGYLANLEYYSTNTVDTSKLKLNSTGADFSDDSVRDYYKHIHFDNSLTDIVARLLKAGRKSILVFTRFVEESEYLKSAMPGIVEVVSGTTPKKEREDILNRFKSGEIKVVSNCGVLTTGFDYPELSTVVMARPTRSLSLWYQIVGRAIRPYDGKRGWIVDMCGNIKQFGRVDDLVLGVEKAGTSRYAIYSRRDGKQLTNVFF